MRQNNTIHSAVAHSTAYFFLDTCNPGFQRVFEPFLRVFKVFPHSKGFQSSRNWFKYSEKQISFILVVGIRATFTCFQHLRPRNRGFCTKQKIASISITWNRGKSGDIQHTYIRISEIKLVLTQETQAGHVLDRN